MIKRSIIAALVALAGTVVAVLPATPAQARACVINYYCYTTWYSNSAHTTVVGWKYETCDGTTTMGGIHSGYITFGEYPC